MFGFKISLKTAVVIIFLIFAVCVHQHTWAEETPYLKYQEPQPADSPSYLATGSYVLSLLATFLVVLGLAYFTSRLISHKMRFTAGNKNGKIISALSFGSGRGVYIVEVAGKYLILGVTDQNINLLTEISDQKELEKIMAIKVKQASGFIPGYNQSVEPNESFEAVFQRQLTSLKQMSQKFPGILKTESDDNESAAIVKKDKDYPH